MKDAKTVTADGKHFELAANIGTPKDVEGVNENGAEAVGLYRTDSCTWILKTSQLKTTNTKLTKQFLKV